MNSCQLADMRLWAYKAFQDSPQKISKIKKFIFRKEKTKKEKEFCCK